MLWEGVVPRLHVVSMLGEGVVPRLHVVPMLWGGVVTRLLLVSQQSGMDDSPASGGYAACNALLTFSTCAALSGLRLSAAVAVGMQLNMANS